MAAVSLMVRKKPAAIITNVQACRNSRETTASDATTARTTARSCAGIVIIISAPSRSVGTIGSVGYRWLLTKSTGTLLVCNHNVQQQGGGGEWQLGAVSAKDNDKPCGKHPHAPAHVAQCNTSRPHFAAPPASHLHEVEELRDPARLRGGGAADLQQRRDALQRGGDVLVELEVLRLVAAPRAAAVALVVEPAVGPARRPGEGAAMGSESQRRVRAAGGHARLQCASQHAGSGNSDPCLPQLSHSLVPYLELEGRHDVCTQPTNQPTNPRTRTSESGRLNGGLTAGKRLVAAEPHARSVGALLKPCAGHAPRTHRGRTAGRGGTRTGR